MHLYPDKDCNFLYCQVQISLQEKEIDMHTAHRKLHILLDLSATLLLCCGVTAMEKYKLIGICHADYYRKKYCDKLISL